MNNSKILLSTLLLASLAANAFLFKLVIDWQDAWLEQILTTSTVERLLITSSADISYDAMKKQVKKELGEFKVLPVSDENFGNNGAVLIQGTKLLFNNGAYIGSTANLPKHLNHWGIGSDEL